MGNRMRAMGIAMAGLSALTPVRGLADAASEARLRDALRAATAQVRTLEDEKVAWQAREETLRKEVEALRRRPPPADGGDRKAAERERKLALEVENAKQLQASLERCQVLSKERAEAAQDLERQRTRLATEVTTLEGRLAAGEARVTAMYRVAKEVLDWIDLLGPGAAYDAREPFLGLKRVELENVSQDYRDKLLDLKVKR